MKHFTNTRGQVVGSLFDDGVFRKKVSGETHLYKNDNGWGIDSKILNELPDKTEIRILDKDDGIVYITTKEIFQSGSKVDFGHGEQTILWRGYFDTVKDGVRTKSDTVNEWMSSYALFEAYPNI